MRVDVDIAHPQETSRSVHLSDVLVDTGATTTTVPRTIADGLDLPVLGTKMVRTVEGFVEVDQAYAMVSVGGGRTVHEVYVSDTYSRVLIGCVTLELLGFAVDPVNNRLIAAEQLLL